MDFKFPTSSDYLAKNVQSSEHASCSEICRQPAAFAKGKATSDPVQLGGRHGACCALCHLRHVAHCLIHGLQGKPI